MSWMLKRFYLNPSACSFENAKYLANIMDDWTITCDEVAESYDEETKTIPENFNEKKTICKMQKKNFYLHFY